MNKGTQKGEGPETEGKVRDCRRKAEPSASLNQGQQEKHWGNTLGHTGAEVRTRRKHRPQWMTETGSYRKEQEAKTITNSNQNEKKRASILPRPIDKH